MLNKILIGFVGYGTTAFSHWIGDIDINVGEVMLEVMKSVPAIVATLYLLWKWRNAIEDRKEQKSKKSDNP